MLDSRVFKLPLVAMFLLVNNAVSDEPQKGDKPDDNGPAKVAGRTLAEWTKDLGANSELVRLRAVKSLGPFGAAAIDPLEKGLNDSSEAVQYWAADHLGKIGVQLSRIKQAERIRMRLEELCLKQESAIVIAAAYARFQMDAGKKWLEILTDKLNSPHREMACSAAEFLGKIGPKATPALPQLEQHFKGHKDYHVRGACQNAIRKIKQEPVR